MVASGAVTDKSLTKSLTPPAGDAYSIQPLQVCPGRFFDVLSAKTVMLRGAAAAAIALAASSAALAQPEIRMTGGHDGLEERANEIIGEFEEPENLIQARQNAREAAKKIDALLRSTGYYAAQIEAYAEASASDDAPPQAIIEVETGERFTFGAIDYSYSRPLIDPAIAERIASESILESGEPALAEEVTAAEAAAVTELRESGYPDAGADERRAVVDHNTHLMNVTYNLETGRPARLGEIEVARGSDIRPGYARSLKPYDIGEQYTPEAIKTLSQYISGTGAYEEVNVRLADSQPGEGWETRPVLVEAKEGQTQTIELGGSYYTTEGVGVEALWTKRNLFDGAEILEIDARAATIERSVEARLKFPHFLMPRRLLTLRSKAIQEETDAYDRMAAIIGADVEQPFTEYIAGGFGAELEVSRVEDFVTGERDFFIARTYLDARYDDTDDLLDPTEGVRANIRVEPTAGFGDDNVYYLKSLASISAYQKITGSPRVIAAGRLLGGTIFGASATDLPADERFYSGGGGSVRGYAYQSIGPTGPNGDPSGGRSVLEASGELRVKFRPRWGVVGFVDAGTADRDSFPGFDEVKVGAGAGVRYHTDFGPIRADVAFPLDEGDGVQLYISIGQAF